MTIFERILAGELPASLVHRDGRFIAFMDIRPMSPGHTLVCPVQAVATLDELDRETRDALWELARRVGAAQRQGLGSLAQHFLVNDGRDASQSVPHVHIHVIPRYRGDALRTMVRMAAHTGLRLVPVPVSARRRGQLDEQARKICAALDR